MALVHVPHVVVIRAPEQEHYRLLVEPFWVSVVAGALRSTSSSEIRAKVDGVFRVACDQRHRTLVLGAWGCGAFGNDATEVASIMVAATRAAAGCIDHVVFAVPRANDKYTAFLAAAPEAELVVPRLGAAADHGSDTSAGLAPAKWELIAAHAELMAALHAGTMASAAARAGVSAVMLETPQGAQRAAQMWLHEVTALCVEVLADACPHYVVSTLCAGLHSSGDADVASPSADVLELQDEFCKAARVLVKDYFLLQRRSQCEQRGP
jgi:hypothetical protein